MKKQHGFTLIELVVVIVILGVLSIIAAPKFLNLQDDAKVSSLKGLAASIQGSASIIYIKAGLAGKETLAEATLDVPGVDGGIVDLVYGYPTAYPISKGGRGIQKVVDGLETDWEMLYYTTFKGGGTIVFGYDLNYDCKLTYSQATSPTEPATVKLSGSVENCSLGEAN